MGDIKTKKKVLFFVGSGVGGAERMTIRIAKFLDLSEFIPIFVIVGKQKGNITDFIPKNYGIEYIHIRNIYDFTTLRLLNLMRKESPNVVFCSSTYLSVRVIMAAHILGNIKIIVRSPNSFASFPKSIQCLVKLTYKYTDVIIAQQEEMRQEFLSCLKLLENKIVTLQNPIDTDFIDSHIKVESPYKDNNQTKYLWVGRFDYTKGQDILVKAFKKVKETKLNAHLYLVGKYNKDSSFYKDVETFVNNNNLTDSVHFVGYDDNPYRWVKYCDCFVQPSRLEGLPNALIEAMYLQKPVAATECIPIINRIIKDGYNGYVVPSEDISSLSDAMIKALNLSNFTMTYKPASQEDFVELFS